MLGNQLIAHHGGRQVWRKPLGKLVDAHAAAFLLSRREPGLELVALRRVCGLV